MGWLRWILYGFACFAFVVLLCLIALNIYSIINEATPDHYCYCCRDQNNFVPPVLFRETIGNSEAFWTAIASLVGVIAIAFLFDQIVTSNAAVIQTQRSVDAQIESDRGRLWVQHMSTKMVGDKRYTHYVVENIGKTAVELMYYGHTQECIERNAIKTIKPVGWHRLLYTMIGSGVRIGTIEREGTLQLLHAVEWKPEFKEQRERKSDYRIVLTFVYRTVYNDIWQYRHTAVWEYGSTVFNSIPGPDYTFDVPAAHLEQPHNVE